jgi:hypothetical protein
MALDSNTSVNTVFVFPVSTNAITIHQVMKVESWELFLTPFLIAPDLVTDCRLLNHHKTW